VTDLLDLVVAAHGRRERRSHINVINSDMSITGGPWTRKGWPNVLSDVHVAAHAREQRISDYPFTVEGKRSRYTPDYAAIETLHRDIIKERRGPRCAFKGHTLEAAWDDLDLAHFSGAAIQNSPFLFTTPGFEAEELPPVNEKKEFRRLKTNFASSTAIGCPEQVFDVDSRNMITRIDDFSQVTDSVPVAHSLSEYKFGDVIRFVSKRRAHPRNPDGTADRYRVLVAIDSAEIQLSWA
jgi:hypothetical protein